MSRCISFESYIKPQHLCEPPNRHPVVYLLNPTSNHNCRKPYRCFYWLYIFWILHQTTTRRCSDTVHTGCISFESYIKPQRKGGFFLILDSCISFESYIKPQHVGKWQQNFQSCISFESYIKPQPSVMKTTLWSCCISFESYIKPQPQWVVDSLGGVVYLLNPTSNHNFSRIAIILLALYIFWILHQTTTMQ